jgi:hypothetical protein
MCYVDITVLLLVGFIMSISILAKKVDWRIGIVQLREKD